MKLRDIMKAKMDSFEVTVRLLRPEFVRAVGHYTSWKCTNFVFSPVTCGGPVYLEVRNDQSGVGGSGWCKKHLAAELGIDLAIEVDG